MSDARTAKATATRLRRRNTMRDELFNTVSTGPARTDWQYAFELDMPLPAVRLAFMEDPRFPPLMRQGQIAVPARTLRYPRWATMHLSPEEQANLPTVSNESKLPTDLLPVVHTGDSAMDADIGQLEGDHLDYARRLSPRRARARLAEVAIVFGRVIDHTAQTTAENISLKQNDHIHRQHIARLERDKDRAVKQLASAEAKLARMESESTDDLDKAA